MPVALADRLAAVAYLPAGASLRIDGVSWEEYAGLLEDLGEGYAVRVFFDRGRMEIMAPTGAHERPSRILHTLITALRDELDIDIESLGSTTLKSEMKARGAEPDDCFYIQNASRVIGKEDLDISRDPSPDLVIEVDRTSASLDKFPIYAALGVPEIWRLAGGKAEFHLLAQGRYRSSPISRAFPFLTARAVSDHLAVGANRGERRAAQVFRVWIRKNRKRS